MTCGGARSRWRTQVLENVLQIAHDVALPQWADERQVRHFPPPRRWSNGCAIPIAPPKAASANASRSSAWSSVNTASPAADTKGTAA
jgi:hypothetical protein